MSVSLNQLSMIFTTLTIEIRNFSIMFLARRTFDIKEDKLELEYHNENLMMKRDLGFVYEDICRNLEIIPGFHLYITEIN